MKAVLERIRDGLRSGRFGSEAAVSQGVVLPLLAELGWSVFDIRCVAPEYSLGGRRVDFAHLDSSGRPRVFVEVKRLGHTDGADVQLFEYAFHEGVQMAVLTDGQEWTVYLPAEQGSYEERRVYKLDLLERTPDECESRLRRYLGCDRALSGAALQDARNDYNDAATGRLIQKTLPIAWTRIVKDQDEMLVELLADKVEDLCGRKPSVDDCAAFLTHLVDLIPPRSPPVLDHDAEKSTQQHVQVGPRGPKGPFGYSLNGKHVAARSARDVLVGLVGALADRDATFLERFAARGRGRSRRYVSQDKYELYRDRPDLCNEHSTEVRPGWWLGLNYSRSGIARNLALAIEVAGLRRGVDVEFSVE